MNSEYLDSKSDLPVRTVMMVALKEILRRHRNSRAKISSQCDTLISKKLVEDMIKELE